MNEELGAKQMARQKYDAVASTYSSRYSDPAAIARRQVGLVAGWGKKVAPGARVLEVGCGDGFVTDALIRAGYVVTAVDFSPGMVEATRDRLAAAGLEADVHVADVDHMELCVPFDAVLAMMWTFFRYTADARRTLASLATKTETKLLVDVNPRDLGVTAASSLLQEVGFDRVGWRPLLLPQRHRLPAAVIATLAVAERVPIVRAMYPRWRGNVLLKGERTRAP
jgi:SAM-dependent methyltransferase